MKCKKTDFDYLKTEVGLNEVSGYADGIGPWINHVVTGKNISGDFQLTGLVKMAHLRNLKVHPYTLRKDRLPSYAETFEDLLHIFFNLAQVDGVITDFPDPLSPTTQRISPLRTSKLTSSTANGLSAFLGRVIDRSLMFRIEFDNFLIL